MKEFFKKLFAFIGKSNCEDNGNPSNVRILTMYSVGMIVPSMCFVLIYCAFKQPGLTVALFGVMSGIVIGALGIKALQKGSEQKTLPQSLPFENGGKQE